MASIAKHFENVQNSEANQIPSTASAPLQIISQSASKTEQPICNENEDTGKQDDRNSSQLSDDHENINNGSNKPGSVQESGTDDSNDESDSGSDCSSSDCSGHSNSTDSGSDDSGSDSAVSDDDAGDENGDAGDDPENQGHGDETAINNDDNPENQGLVSSSDQQGGIEGARNQGDLQAKKADEGVTNNEQEEQGEEEKQESAAPVVLNASELLLNPFEMSSINPPKNCSSKQRTKVDEGEIDENDDDGNQAAAENENEINNVDENEDDGVEEQDEQKDDGGNEDGNISDDGESDDDDDESSYSSSSSEDNEEENGEETGQLKNANLTDDDDEKGGKDPNEKLPGSEVPRPKSSSASQVRKNDIGAIQNLGKTPVYDHRSIRWPSVNQSNDFEGKGDKTRAVITNVTGGKRVVVKEELEDSGTDGDIDEPSGNDDGDDEDVEEDFKDSPELLALLNQYSQKQQSKLLDHRQHSTETPQSSTGGNSSAVASTSTAQSESTNNASETTLCPPVVSQTVPVPPQSQVPFPCPPAVPKTVTAASKSQVPFPCPPAESKTVAAAPKSQVSFPCLPAVSQTQVPPPKNLISIKQIKTEKIESNQHHPAQETASASSHRPSRTGFPAAGTPSSSAIIHQLPKEDTQRSGQTKSSSKRLRKIAANSIPEAEIELQLKRLKQELVEDEESSFPSDSVNPPPAATNSSKANNHSVEHSTESRQQISSESEKRQQTTAAGIQQKEPASKILQTAMAIKQELPSSVPTNNQPKTPQTIPPSPVPTNNHPKPPQSIPPSSRSTNNHPMPQTIPPSSVPKTNYPKPPQTIPLSSVPTNNQPRRPQTIPTSPVPTNSYPKPPQTIPPSSKSTNNHPKPQTIPPSSVPTNNHPRRSKTKPSSLAAAGVKSDKFKSRQIQTNPPQSLLQQQQHQQSTNDPLQKRRRSSSLANDDVDNADDDNDVKPPNILLLPSTTTKRQKISPVIVNNDKRSPPKNQMLQSAAAVVSSQSAVSVYCAPKSISMESSETPSEPLKPSSSAPLVCPKIEVVISLSDSDSWGKSSPSPSFTSGEHNNNRELKSSSVTNKSILSTSDSCLSYADNPLSTLTANLPPCLNKSSDYSSAPKLSTSLRSSRKGIHHRQHQDDIIEKASGNLTEKSEEENEATGAKKKVARDDSENKEIAEKIKSMQPTNSDDNKPSEVLNKASPKPPFKITTAAPASAPTPAVSLAAISKMIEHELVTTHEKENKNDLKGSTKLLKQTTSGQSRPLKDRIIESVKPNQIISAAAAAAAAGHQGQQQKSIAASVVVECVVCVKPVNLKQSKNSIKTVGAKNFTANNEDDCYDYADVEAHTEKFHMTGERLFRCSICRNAYKTATRNSACGHLLHLHFAQGDVWLENEEAVQKLTNKVISCFPSLAEKRRSFVQSYSKLLPPPPSDEPPGSPEIEIIEPLLTSNATKKTLSSKKKSTLTSNKNSSSSIREKVPLKVGGCLSSNNNNNNKKQKVSDRFIIGGGGGGGPSSMKKKSPSPPPNQQPQQINDPLKPNQQKVSDRFINIGGGGPSSMKKKSPSPLPNQQPQQINDPSKPNQQKVSDRFFIIGGGSPSSMKKKSPSPPPNQQPQQIDDPSKPNQQKVSDRFITIIGGGGPSSMKIKSPSPPPNLRPQQQRPNSTATVSPSPITVPESLTLKTSANVSVGVSSIIETSPPAKKVSEKLSESIGKLKKEAVPLKKELKSSANILVAGTFTEALPPKKAPVKLSENLDKFSNGVRKETLPGAGKAAPVIENLDKFTAGINTVEILSSPETVSERLSENLDKHTIDGVRTEFALPPKKLPGTLSTTTNGTTLPPLTKNVRIEEERPTANPSGVSKPKNVSDLIASLFKRPPLDNQNPAEKLQQPVNTLSLVKTESEKLSLLSTNPCGSGIRSAGRNNPAEKNVTAASLGASKVSPVSKLKSSEKRGRLSAATAANPSDNKVSGSVAVVQKQEAPSKTATITTEKCLSSFHRKSSAPTTLPPSTVNRPTAAAADTAEKSLETSVKTSKLTETPSPTNASTKPDGGVEKKTEVGKKTDAGKKVTAAADLLASFRKIYCPGCDVSFVMIRRGEDEFRADRLIRHVEGKHLLTQDSFACSLCHNTEDTGGQQESSVNSKGTFGTLSAAEKHIQTAHAAQKPVVADGQKAKEPAGKEATAKVKLLNTNLLIEMEAKLKQLFPYWARRVSIRARYTDFIAELQFKPMDCQICAAKASASSGKTPSPPDGGSSQSPAPLTFFRLVPKKPSIIHTLSLARHHAESAHIPRRIRSKTGNASTGDAAATKAGDDFNNNNNNQNLYKCMDDSVQFLTFFAAAKHQNDHMKTTAVGGGKKEEPKICSIRPVKLFWC